MDLHIHSCLSPCGDLSMVPGVVVSRARDRGLDAIGICDHNSAENVRAFQSAGAREGLAVLGGMEICSREEIHLLALFDEWEALAEMQELVYQSLPGRNDPRAFGYQVVVDERDEPVELNERLLIGATALGVGRIAVEVQDRGGLAVASHVDRGSFSLLGQLGFVPEGLALDALEVSPQAGPGAAGERHRPSGLPLVSFSDAHYPAEIGRACTCLPASLPTVAAVKEALRAGEGLRREVVP